MEHSVMRTALQTLYGQTGALSPRKVFIAGEIANRNGDEAGNTDTLSAFDAFVLMRHKHNADM